LSILEEKINSPRGLVVGGIGEIGTLVEMEARLLVLESEDGGVGGGVGEGEREDGDLGVPVPVVLDRLELRRVGDEAG
jgi:hypothetical protein